MTASVPAPSSSSLAPMADVGENLSSPSGVSGGYPAGPPASSQAFPGDYRSPSQAGYDPTATGSVPSMARTSASSSSLIGGGKQADRLRRASGIANGSAGPQPDRRNGLAEIRSR